MKKILYMMLLPLLFVTGCKRNDYVAHVKDIRLVSVDPKNGYPGDLVTVLGNNFSTDLEENLVTVDGVRAQVLEAYHNRLLVIMPDHETGPGTIVVQAPSGTSEGVTFNYLAIPDCEYLVSTIVGQQGVRKCIDGVGTGACTYMPTGINKAADGTLWFTDRGGNKVRHIAKDMTVTTVASVEESGAAVWQGAFDAKGNYWYCDKAKGKLYRYSPASGKNEVMASGLNNPMNVAIDAQGNIYVPCRNAKTVFKFDAETFEKSVFAQIPADGPAFIGFDPKGNMLVSVHNGFKLISIDAEGNQTVILGTGEKSDELQDGEGDPLAATVRSCLGFDFAPDGTLYVGDSGYHCVRKLTPDANGDYSKGKVETVVGGTKGYADGKGLNAKFNEVSGVLVYDANTLYICDAQNCLIRKVSIR